MADNLVKRLRNVQFWQAECDVRMQAAARIEELEERLQASLRLMSNPRQPQYTNEGETE